MKNIVIMAVALFMITASITSRAELGAVKSFVGLWEAVDSGDGSHDILSITDKGDGTFRLLYYSSFLTTCNGGRGIGQGTGEVSAKGTLRSDDFTGTCFETGDTVKLPTTLTLNSDGTLTERELTEPPTPPTIFHRTSK